MPDKSDRLEKYHNKGQEDCSKDEYHPPNNFVATDWSPNSKENIEENKAYSEGWRNTKDQKDKK